MQNFENNLYTTVDSILEILGCEPKVVRQKLPAQTSAPRPQRIDIPRTTTGRMGARLVKSNSELERVLAASASAVK